MSGKDPEYDRWIDQALDDYAAPRDEDTPRRIVAGTMRRVEDWRSRRRRVQLFGLAGALAFACALIITFSLKLPPGMQPAPVSSASAMSLKPPTIAYMQTESDSAPVRHHLVKAVRQKVDPPKLNQFPTPIPLSREEQSLVVRANTPHLTSRQVEQWNQQPQAPIKITALQVADLQVKPLDLTK
jgi:hypothetical protein